MGSAVKSRESESSALNAVVFNGSIWLDDPDNSATDKLGSVVTDARTAVCKWEDTASVVWVSWEGYDEETVRDGVTKVSLCAEVE